MAIKPVMEHFIHAQRFAVIGKVLTDRSRWDNKVLRWYQSRNLPVTPVIPPSVQSSAQEAEGQRILSNPHDLPSLPSTSISIIIHPALGLPILRSLFPRTASHAMSSSDQNGKAGGAGLEAGKEKGAEPWAVWFQPGADSPEIAQYVKEHGLEGKVVFGGPCILVSGGELMGLREKATGKAKV